MTVRNLWESAKGLLLRVRNSIHGHEIEARGDGHFTSAEKFIHFWALCVRGFSQNRCPARAAALAYTTLLALIPLLAVAASISTGLLKSQGEEPIKVLIERLVANVAPQLDLVSKSETESEGRQQVVQAIQDFVGRINTGALGVSGMVGLVFVAIMLFSTIESTFNDIWGVKHGRTWLARIIQYWATVTLGPLIPILVLGLNATSQVKWVEAKLEMMPFVGQFAVRSVPVIFLSLVFGFFYQLMPNTRVRWQAALVGGMVGGVLWQLNSMLSIIYMSRVETYQTIYGPLSLVPVFLVGLYFSWLILLFGSQVAYTFQNRSAYLEERQAERINEVGREFVALRLMTLIGQRFHRGTEPVTAIGAAHHLGVSTRLVTDVLECLLGAHLLNEVEGKEMGYSPARPLGGISCDDIVQAVRAGRGGTTETRSEPVQAVVQSCFQGIRAAEQDKARQQSLEELVRLAEAAEQAPEAG